MRPFGMKKTESEVVFVFEFVQIAITLIFECLHLSFRLMKSTYAQTNTLFVIVSLSFVFCVHTWGVQHSNNICCFGSLFLPLLIITNTNTFSQFVQWRCIAVLNVSASSLTCFCSVSWMNEWMCLHVHTNWAKNVDCCNKLTHVLLTFDSVQFSVCMFTLPVHPNIQFRLIVIAFTLIRHHA